MLCPAGVHKIRSTDYDRGFFARGDMQKEFEEASFSLQPGEISPIVETASGLHLIER